MKFLKCLSILGFASLFVLCSSNGRDFPVAKTSFLSPQASLKNYPDEVGADISETTVEGSVSIRRVMGISLDDFLDSQESDIPLVLNRTDLDDYTQTAVSRAMKSANADGLLLTQVIRKRRGVWPFYYTHTYEVKGKPVKFKSLGTLSTERVELRRYIQFKRKQQIQEQAAWYDFLAFFR